MSISSAAAPSSGIVIGGSGNLPRHPVFRTCDLDEAQRHMCGVFDQRGVTYLPRERRLDFRDRQARVGSITVNSLQWGAGVMVNAPQLPDFYLLQFTLEGECELWQESHHDVLPAQSVAIVNPGRPFRKAWMPRARQLLLRIDSGLVEREFRDWTGGDESGGIEFDMPPVDDIAKVGTLARYVRMVCDHLQSDASDLSHPLVANRVASGLVALLLASMPHNKTHAIEKASKATAPFFVRHAEQFIEKHARDAIALADLTGVAGVSKRALQMGFRRFRDTTPMAYLRSIRLELARAELAKAGRQGRATSDDLLATTRRSSANCLRTLFIAAASGRRAELQPVGHRSAPPFLNVALWRLMDVCDVRTLLDSSSIPPAGSYPRGSIVGTSELSHEFLARPRA